MKTDLNSFLSNHLVLPILIIIETIVGVQTLHSYIIKTAMEGQLETSQQLQNGTYT